MQKKTLIIAMVGVAAIGALGFGILTSGEEERPPPRADAEPEVEDDYERPPPRAATREEWERRREAEREAQRQDDTPPNAPVIVAREPGQTEVVHPPEGLVPMRTIAEERRIDPESQSSGWRLGRTRAHLVTIDQRITTMRDRLHQLESEGDEAMIARQRQVLERFVRRQQQLQSEEIQLQQEAAADGTLNDVDRGVEENTPQPRAPIPVQAPPG